MNSNTDIYTYDGMESDPWEHGSIDTDDILFCQLAECKCCERHRSNKPDKLFGKINAGSNSKRRGAACDCCCRQTMRFLVRKYNQSLWDDNAVPTGG